MHINGIMMQYFEWYLPKGMLWKQLREEAPALAADGITAVWIPPCYKSHIGDDGVGYGVYDLYDLGEFDQRGSIPTRYGTRQELLDAIKAVQAVGLQVYADIVLDHKMGADGMERAEVTAYHPQNRHIPLGPEREVEVWTYFGFPGRGNTYSDFKWHWRHFVGINWEELSREEGIYKFSGKLWESQVDREFGNFEYLMGASIDLNNPEVEEELIRWGEWFVETTGVDGFRLDAVKHMKFTFYMHWLAALRHKFRREFFTVGEYWHGDIAALRHYVDTTVGAISLFDVPLHFNFQQAALYGKAYDIRGIFHDCLTAENPLKSVTFVDNHDTQPGQSLQSWVADWFKPLAYALILLRDEGYPCVFYGDYYGIPHNNIASKRDMLYPLLKARRLCAYGEQRDYFDHPNLIGWTRAGQPRRPYSGLAVLISNDGAASKRMCVGKNHAGAEFYDCTASRPETVHIGADGSGEFHVNARSVSVWVRREMEIKDWK